MKLIKMHRPFRLFNTIKYLKFKQIYYRLFYDVKKFLRSFGNFSYPLCVASQAVPLSLQASIPSHGLLAGDTFTFINLSQKFENGIDWNFSALGKLWTYNLNYFEYLNQKELPMEEGLALILDFLAHIHDVNDGMEPYPISLRGVNWIKFLSMHRIRNQKIDDSLYAQYEILMDNLEYHLLGNHLLENAFSLLFGAYYFQDERFYTKAKALLTVELAEQILEDGGHFELSPMYHQIMLFRLLECINLVRSNDWKNSELLAFMLVKAKQMFGWLNTMTFNNGNIPLMNDSANKIAPTTNALSDYAKRLNLFPDEIHGSLTDSGYRKIKTERYEMIIDVGSIGPDYIPGHAHSDTFSFELYIDGEPRIVDTGLSTYETNERRQIERSTCSHNTVEIDGLNQSFVWGGFRVAERAHIIDLRENDGVIEATHNGYKKQSVLHTRRFEWSNDGITIKDTLQGCKGHTCISYLHFYPGIHVTKEKNVIQCENAVIKLSGSTRVLLEEYEYAPEFNRRVRAKSVKIFFDNELDMQISGI